MADEKPNDVTTQPSISTEEAAETDVELSPVGDEKVEVGEAPVEVEIPVEGTDVQVRSAAKREIEVRLLPWDTTIETRAGPEMFERGAIAGTPADGVLLMGLEHEAHMGLGQNGQPILTRRPAGRSTEVWEADDGPHVAFRVARTQAGDELLALAEDRIVRGVSVEFAEVPGGTKTVNRNGRKVRVHQRVALTGASMTYRPAYGEQAAVLAVRSLDEGVTGMTETTEVPVAGADNAAITAALASIEARGAAQQKILDKLQERDEQQQEQYRSQFSLPAKDDESKVSMGTWAKTVFDLLTGERISDQQMRSLDDVITTDNPGVIPEIFLSELRGIIDPSRPFMATTRKLDIPDAGMTLNVPIITQRPTAEVQATEKTEVSSQKTLIGRGSFEPKTIAGAGDLSVQLIKRSSPAFLSLWVELLAEAYAIEAEDQALQALFNATGGVGAGEALNPNSLSLGPAYMASFDAIRRPPDTIWLSTEAVAEFIDAKATTTNQPLYPGLAASATAAGGITGVISGLRPVHVPALDAHGAYAIVGPSSGFAWAEDGTYTLQVDVPAKLGRDVALFGMVWFVPWYPAAFTSWNVAS